MEQDSLFEIFKQSQPDSDWAKMATQPTREAARALADEILNDEDVFAVRITKTITNPTTGRNRVIKVFEKKKAREEETHSSTTVTRTPSWCHNVEDLFKPFARHHIAKLLGKQLHSWRITPIELLHNPVKLKQLQNAGTILLHAIQRISVAQSSKSSQSVSEIIRQLTALTDEVFIMAHYADKDALGKISRLLAFTEELSDDTPLYADAMAAIDIFVSEIIQYTPSISALLSRRNASPIAQIDILIDLCSADRNGNLIGYPALQKLSRIQTHETFPETRHAIGHRLLQEMESCRFLEFGPFDQAFDLFHETSLRIAKCQGAYVSGHDIAHCLSNSSKRFVTRHAIDKALARVKRFEDQIERLIDMEPRIAGRENKAALAGYLSPLIFSREAEHYFVNSDAPIIKRIEKASHFQRQIAETGFPNRNKKEMATALDRFARQAIEKVDWLNGLSQKAGNDAEASMVLLRLLAAQVFPEGECIKRAEDKAIQCLASPDFMTQLMEVPPSKTFAEAFPASATKAIVEEFKKLLIDTGMGRQLVSRGVHVA